MIDFLFSLFTGYISACAAIGKAIGMHQSAVFLLSFVAIGFFFSAIKALQK